MSRHVDILRNDWLAGEQRPIARLYVAGGELKIDSPEPARWIPLVEDVLGDLVAAHEGDPEAVLIEVPNVFRGSQLLATAPHGDGDCDYRNWASARIESVSSDRQIART
jgi:hypothetical protein